MAWKRIICWWKGHNVEQFKYAVKSTKKYHGHDEVRSYGGCTRCGKGSPTDELRWVRDGKAFMERNDWIYPVAFVIGAFSLLAAIIIFPTIWIGKKACFEAGLAMDIETKWYFWTGCYYNIDGRWVHEGLLKVVDLIK